MDTNAKQQYMDTLRKEYHVTSKKRKGELLDEYCKRTGEDRKYAIKKLRNKVRIKKQEDRKKRPKTYDGLVVSALVAVWNIFDRPCGQRLRPLLTDEIDRLRTWKELTCTDDVATKLKCMSSATIDRRLHHEKETLLLNLKHKPKRNTPLLSQVPVKTVADLDRQCPGSIQIDCVEHCGLSASGEYIHSLTTVDILTGWWEGEALMGKGQERAHWASVCFARRSAARATRSSLVNCLYINACGC